MAFALQVIVRWLLGVRALIPGYARVLVMPQLGPLTHVAGAVPTVRGAITLSAAQVLGGGGLPVSFSLNLTVPGAVAARACLPASACGASVLVDGRVVAGETEGDYACVELASGVHALTCPA